MTKSKNTNPRNPTTRREAVARCREKQEEIGRLLSAIKTRVDVHTDAAIRSPDPDAPWLHLGDLGVVEQHLKTAWTFMTT